MSNKKQRDIELFIVDIFVAIEKTREYTSTFQNVSDFKHSSLHWDATIRQLEVIGEALNKLLEDTKFKLLAPIYFRKVVSFRNNIVHGYFGIDADEVWSVVTRHLHLLEVDLSNIIRDNIDISEAILCEIDEYMKLDDTKIVKYLMKLKQ